MFKNTYLYILLKLLLLRNPYLLLNYISLINNTNNSTYFLKNFFLNKLTNLRLVEFNKKLGCYALNSLLSVEITIKNSINSGKPVYFLPINNENSDTDLINKYLNNFEPITNIGLLLNNRKYRNIKRSIINTYNPSLLICINSFKNFRLISNIKSLGIPSIGLVDSSVINPPFEINIHVPTISPYFQIYYFFLIFKLIVYYKKLYIKFLIYNFINFKLIYLKKL
jgi:hypothetical protein